jgi:hypothetical protein
MKKFIIIIALLFNFSSIKAQVFPDSTSEDVIRNSQFIIEGYSKDVSYCNCYSDDFYDEIIKIKLSSVLRGTNLFIGDTIMLLIPKIGNGKKDFGSMIIPFDNDRVRLRLANIKGEGFGGLFLNLNKALIIDKEWANKKLFVLYPSKTFSSYWPNDFYVENPEFEITALNWLKFKTKQDWYNYLKQFPDIKIPGEK